MNKNALPEVLGFSAAERGESKTSNPFRNPSSQLYIAWNAGWELGTRGAALVTTVGTQTQRQSKLLSFIEALANTAVGLAISFGFQLFLNYVYGIEMTDSVAFQMVAAFTVLSVVRSYVVRRVFNRIKE